jgi:hypothetical protein
MKIYLSARQSRREELRTYRDQLRALGHEVVCSWLDLPGEAEAPKPSDHHGDAGGGNEPGHGSDMSFGDRYGTLKTREELHMAKEAETRYWEILDCELFVAFTDAENHTREASYAEFGLALGVRGKRSWIVGQRYHTLHWYKDVPAFADWPKFLVALKALGTAERIVGEQGQKGG